MNISRYNYWLYAILTIFFCWILYNISKSNWVMLSFYLFSCFYLALYFIIKFSVISIINKKYKKKKDNLDCNINECKNIECNDLSDKECKVQKYCFKTSGGICIKDEEKCNELDEIENKINIEMDVKIKQKFEKLDYYKIRGIDFKKHINYYLIILIITFFIYLFIIILMK